jgi:phosphoglycerate dehydrogenase-like enzyme
MSSMSRPERDRALAICVHHARFPDAIARAVTAALSPTSVPWDVVVNADETRAPPANVEVLIGIRFPAGAGARLPRLRFVQLTGMGRDAIAGLAPPASVVVADVGNVHARAVAEHAMYGLLLGMRGGPAMTYGSRSTKSASRETMWSSAAVQQAHARRVVVLGAGSIARELVPRLRALSMIPVVVARVAGARECFGEVAGVADVPALLRHADALVVAVPLSVETRGFVDAALLARLPHGACVVDVSRGGIVDAKALAAAVESGAIRAALVDVHEPEPLPSDAPIWSTSAIAVTPHSAWMTDRHAADVARVCAENVRRFAAGEALLPDTVRRA